MDHPGRRLRRSTPRDRRSPAPTTRSSRTRQRILIDSLLAPINGTVRHRGSGTGNVDVFNSGTLFGAIDVAFFILVIGGFIAITMKTGAIQAGIARLVGRLRGHERWMIPILMTVFAVGGTTFGMAEESLAFYVLIITVMIAAGYDALVGALVILLGCGIGVLGSTVNPFATGIASGFADVPLSDGLALRLVILIVGLVAGIWFVSRYAERVRHDPSQSLVYDMKAGQRAALRGRRPTTPARSCSPDGTRSSSTLFGRRSW